MSTPRRPATAGKRPPGLPQRALLALIPVLVASSSLQACGSGDRESASSVSDERPEQDWIPTLVDALAAGTVDQSGAIDLHGTAGGRDANDNIIVTPTRAEISSATVGDLDHVGIDLAVDIAFVPGEGPTLAELERVFGVSSLVVPLTDGADGRPARSMSYRPARQPYQVRIVATLGESETDIVALHIDREPSPQN